MQSEIIVADAVTLRYRGQISKFRFFIERKLPYPMSLFVNWWRISDWRYFFYTLFWGTPVENREQGWHHDDSSLKYQMIII